MFCQMPACICSNQTPLYDFGGKGSDRASLLQETFSDLLLAKRSTNIPDMGFFNLGGRALTSLGQDYADEFVH
jgi:hypothetical protein